MEVEHESEKDDSNVVVVNTCGFIDNAKEESINTILEQAQKKRMSVRALQARFGKRNAECRSVFWYHKIYQNCCKP